MFLITPNRIDREQILLSGNNHYKYLYVAKDRNDFYKKKKGLDDFFTIWDEKISNMVYKNSRQFAGKEIGDLNVFSVDLETVGLLFQEFKKILLIPTTAIIDGKEVKKLFSIDEYDSEKDMLEDFLRYMDSFHIDIMVGHNLFGFDLPYFADRFDQLRIEHNWQFDHSSRRDRMFRVDGSLSTNYRGVTIPGIEIVDTLFLAKKSDSQKKFENYRLKSLCTELGINQNRQHYDASKIGANWDDPVERAKIKAYAIDDADDALALFYKFIPPYFFMLKSIPMNLQEIINRASGSQINLMFVAHYLSNNHSIPKTDEVYPFEGGISKAFPGVYENCLGFDVISMYPSIIVNCDIRPKKDELNFLQTITKKLLTDRLAYKKKYRETGDENYNHLQGSYKIIINSFYGFMGTPGLEFNAPKEAEAVTRNGREIITKAVEWSRGKGFQVAQIDTDGFIFNGADLNHKEKLLDELNTLIPNGVEFEADDPLKCVVMVKAKNYAKLDFDDKVTIKGSAFKSSSKEPALKEMCAEILKSLLGLNKIEPFKIYHQYVKETKKITDISRWCSKKTVTPAVLNSERTQEKRIRNAIKDSGFSIGDKFYIYFKSSEEMKTIDDFDGQYDFDKYLEKVHKALKPFNTVLNMDDFPNYKLKRNKPLLEAV